MNKSPPRKKSLNRLNDLREMNQSEIEFKIQRRKNKEHLFESKHELINLQMSVL